MDNFLSDQQTVGEKNSSGSFTLAADGKALRKMANFSLPFKEAWALKLVQFAVAAGASEIRVKLKRKSAVFSFPGLSKEALKGLGDAFASVKPSGSRALDYLLMALRQVGMQQNRSFRLTSSDFSLVWDGDNLSRPKSAKSTEFVTVELEHLSETEKRDYFWFVRGSLSAERSLEIQKILRDRCFTSPIPLSVDSVSVSGLFKRVPEAYEVQQIRVPVQIVFPEIEAPAFPIPAGTIPDDYSAEFESWCEQQGGEVKSACVISYLLTLGPRNEGPRKLVLREGSSYYHIVKDGVVIAREKLKIPAMKISVDLFLSGDDLSLDLSGFGIREPDIVTERVKQVAKDLERELPKVSGTNEFLASRPSELHKVHPSADRILQPYVAGMSSTYGGAMVAMMTVKGLVFPIGVAAGYVGFKLGKLLGKRGRERMPLPPLSEELDSLLTEWKIYVSNFTGD